MIQTDHMHLDGISLGCLDFTSLGSDHDHEEDEESKGIRSTRLENDMRKT